MIYRTLPAALVSASLILVACQKPADVAVSGETETMNMTFDDLKGMEESVTCVFNHTGEDSENVTGTVYVEAGGKRVSGEFDVNEAGEMYDAQMLHMNNTTYVWSSQQPEGFLIHAEDGTLFGDAEGQTALDTEETFKFSCTPWEVDSARFELPADREFIDIQAQMELMMEGLNERVNGNGDVKTMQCAICDEMPEESGKAECKKALGC